MVQSRSLTLNTSICAAMVEVACKKFKKSEDFKECGFDEDRVVEIDVWGQPVDDWACEHQGRFRGIQGSRYVKCSDAKAACTEFRKFEKMPTKTIQRPCTSCYNGVDNNCHTCDDVIKSYQKKGWYYNPQDFRQCNHLAPC
jgi:hypothetical protein